MVLFFRSTDEDLLRHGLPEDVWFHVDKLSSAHVYLRLPHTIPSWTDIPEALLEDCAQLVKANSIEGTSNAPLMLQKTGDMAVGAVTFFNDRQVKRFYVKERQNAIVNRLNKTREERQVDYEAERQERERALGRKKKEFANAQVLETKRRHQAEAAARDYSHLYSEEAIAEQHRIEERRARVKAAQGADGSDSEAAESDDSFM
ncbi:hypothetical protein CBS14141_004292 [Malassezia furfur]|nr:hypothetical protein CBS14141_004292 [Malassezia furfur]